MPSVTRDVEIDAEPAEVWERVVQADWIGPGRIDPAPGGAVDVHDVETGEHRVGAVREAESGQRIRFTWWPAVRADEVSDVEIVLLPAATGTRVVVTETVGEGRPWSLRLFAMATGRMSARA